MNSYGLTDVYIQLAERIIGNKFGENIEGSLVIAERILQSVMEIYFHGTNLSALEGIREHGLSRERRDFECNEIEEMISIMKRIGESEQTFGWYKLNSEDKIFVTGDAEAAYSYAEGSPEWFDQFTSKFSHEQSFRNRNYEDALKYLKMRIEKWKNRSEEELKYGRKNLQPQEEQAILAFFEKYWKKYARHDEAVVIRLEHPERSSDDSPIKEIALWFQVLNKISKEELDFSNEDEEKLRLSVLKHATPERIREAIRLEISQMRRTIDTRIEDEDIGHEKLSYYIVPLKPIATG
ncbi:MAG: hypothetical protein WC858_01500 [Parcubacteria group bacterium]